MKIDKLVFEEKSWNLLDTKECNPNLVDVIFVFGHIDTLKNHNHSSLLQSLYPNAQVVGCSTAGNILDSSVDSHDAVASAISFNSGYTKITSKKINVTTLSQDVETLVTMVEKKDLKHILFLAPGLINGSDILDGISSIDKSITVSGGLAGDEHEFKTTYQFLNEKNHENLAICIGFYGKSLHVRIGCETGWQEFGAKRIVTKSFKNRVQEIDDEPAINLYKKYLGDKIDALPNSTLRFPLSIREHENDKNNIIRVIMSIDKDNSLVFAGDVKEGSIVRLMKSNVSNILDGAFLSAKKIRPYNNKRALGLTISCSARRSVLKQFSDEEIDIVQDILCDNTQIIGFYSYGEITPFSDELSKPLLHNQTMTITAIYED